MPFATMQQVCLSPAGLHPRHGLQGRRPARRRTRSSTGTLVVASVDPDLRAAALAATGFMPQTRATPSTRPRWPPARPCPGAPFLEVGSYCGRSTVWLGAAARGRAPSCSRSTTTGARRRTRPAGSGTTPSLVDADLGVMDTLPPVPPHHLRRRSGGRRGRRRRPVADGGRHWRHAAGAAASSTAATASSRPGPTTPAGRPTSRSDGLLAIHDVFPDPADGGRPPYEEIYLPALASGRFVRRLGARARSGSCAAHP